MKKIVGYIIICVLFAWSLLGTYFGIKFAIINSDLKGVSEYIEIIKEKDKTNIQLTKERDGWLLSYTLEKEENEARKELVVSLLEDISILENEKINNEENSILIEQLNFEISELQSRVKELNDIITLKDEQLALLQSEIDRLTLLLLEYEKTSNNLNVEGIEEAIKQNTGENTIELKYISDVDGWIFATSGNYLYFANIYDCGFEGEFSSENLISCIADVENVYFLRCTSLSVLIKDVAKNSAYSSFLSNVYFLDMFYNLGDDGENVFLMSAMFVIRLDGKVEMLSSDVVFAQSAENYSIAEMLCVSVLGFSGLKENINSSIYTTAMSEGETGLFEDNLL